MRGLVPREQSRVMAVSILLQRVKRSGPQKVPAVMAGTLFYLPQH